jgi:hypothetical protein
MTIVLEITDYKAVIKPGGIQVGPGDQTVVANAINIRAKGPWSVDNGELVVCLSGSGLGGNHARQGQHQQHEDHLTSVHLFAPFKGVEVMGRKYST